MGDIQSLPSIDVPLIGSGIDLFDSDFISLLLNFFLPNWIDFI